MRQELYNATCEGLKEIGLGSWFLPQNFSICGIKNRKPVLFTDSDVPFLSFYHFPVFATEIVKENERRKISGRKEN